MHGVKRLFAWMIPRFDRERFKVSLVSLRKKDLSEETLEALGIDITYLERSKFDPRTLPALLEVIDASRSTSCICTATAPRRSAGMAAALRRIPTILHEHANLTDTPWFQKVADRLLEPLHRHRPRRLEEHRRFRDRRAPGAGVEGEGGVPRRAARRVQPRRGRRRDRRGARGARHRAATSSRSAPSPGCTSRRATPTWSRRRRASSANGPRRGFSWSGEGPLLPICRRRRRGSASATGSCSPASSATSRARCRRST